MTDTVDAAKELELLQRQDAINRQLAKSKEKPNNIGGIRYCLDCDGEVPKARIAALPDVVRCIDCQSLNEIRSR
ncbi:MAG: TraR/DksA family transcriptional regulator [Gammaproteobacteria bacterium]|nr:TraR/DksA C4-type zinc finger protein [Psychrosphaera sp.]NRA56257.1 TraR/DksA family transcriptional regulator [Gammaproteobacteria bacterium]